MFIFEITRLKRVTIFVWNLVIDSCGIRFFLETVLEMVPIQEVWGCGGIWWIVKLKIEMAWLPELMGKWTDHHWVGGCVMLCGMYCYVVNFLLLYEMGCCIAFMHSGSRDKFISTVIAASRSCRKSPLMLFCGHSYIFHARLGLVW